MKPFAVIPILGITLALTACGRSLNSEVNLSTDPITFRFASNVDEDVLLSFAVSGPFSDCKPDSDTPMLEPVVWSISDELGLPDTITYGEIPPEALNNVPAQALQSGDCYEFHMASTGGTEWARFEAP